MCYNICAPHLYKHYSRNLVMSESNWVYIVSDIKAFAPLYSLENIFIFVLLLDLKINSESWEKSNPEKLCLV